MQWAKNIIIQPKLKKFPNINIKTRGTVFYTLHVLFLVNNCVFITTDQQLDTHLK